MSDLEQRIADALRDPKNLGELEGADAVGMVGNAQCGEMLRLWLKFKTEKGKKVIDRATFQSFGCETAIAVASLATELIRGKTPQEAMAMSGEELAGTLGPLPPMKIHCAQLVEEALRSALSDELTQPANPGQVQPSNDAPRGGSNLLENITARGEEKVRVVFVKKENGA